MVEDKETHCIPVFIIEPILLTYSVLSQRLGPNVRMISFAPQVFTTSHRCDPC
jgi:hypothetical protein